MSAIRSLRPWKVFAFVLCAFTFLLFAQGAVSRAVAADEWPMWPRKPVEPGVETTPTPPPATSVEKGASTAGTTGGAKTSSGISTGTVGLVLLGLGAAVAIGVAAGGNSSTTSTSSTCNQ